MKKNKAYLGITGSTTVEETQQLCDVFSTIGLNKESSHVPMLGFLVSYKTLYGGKHTTSLRYPDVKDLRPMLEIANKIAFTTIHYNTPSYNPLFEEIDYLLNCYLGLIDGIQFNMVKPKREELLKIKNYHGVKLILQLNNRSIKGKTIEQIIRMLQTKYAFVDYILLDPSGGRGKEFDMIKTTELYRQIVRAGIKATIGFAGGFSEFNVYKRVKFLKNNLGNNNFSIDAESKLRKKVGTEYGQDVLVHKKAEEYIRQAARALIGYKNLKKE